MERAVIRERRQVTLPRELCEQLGLEIGDTITLEVEDGSLRMTPSKKVALDALTELRRLFAESGISEKEFQADLRRTREEMSRERYGHLRKA